VLRTSGKGGRRERTMGPSFRPLGNLKGESRVGKEDTERPAGATDGKVRGETGQAYKRRTPKRKYDAGTNRLSPGEGEKRNWKGGHWRVL